MEPVNANTCELVDVTCNTDTVRCAMGLIFVGGVASGPPLERVPVLVSYSKGSLFWSPMNNINCQGGLGFGP